MDTSCRLTLTSPIINAIGAQIKYQSTHSAILDVSSSMIPPASTGTPQPSSASRLSSGAIAGIVVGSAVSLALIIEACICLFVSKRRKARTAQNGQIRGPDQTDHDTNVTTSQAPQPFIKPELPGSTPANNPSEKPELGGTQVWNIALPPTWQQTSAVARDVELAGLRDPAELENASRPAELPG